MSKVIRSTCVLAALACMSYLWAQGLNRVLPDRGLSASLTFLTLGLCLGSGIVGLDGLPSMNLGSKLCLAACECMAIMGLMLAGEQLVPHLSLAILVSLPLGELIAGLCCEMAPRIITKIISTVGMMALAITNMIVLDNNVEASMGLSLAAYMLPIIGYFLQERGLPGGLSTIPLLFTSLGSGRLIRQI